MFNPYEVMYDSVMDVYRYQDKKDDAGFDASGESLVASSVKCRYSISNQEARCLPCRRLISSSADWKRISGKVTKWWSRCETDGR